MGTLMHIRRIAARNHQFIVYSSRISSIKRSSNFLNNYNKRRALHDNIKMGSGGEGFTNEIEKKAKMMSAEDETLFENKLRVKKLSEHATVPVRGSDGAAGYDLSAASIASSKRNRKSSSRRTCPSRFRRTRTLESLREVVWRIKNSSTS